LKILFVNVAVAEEGDDYVINHMIPLWRKNLEPVKLEDTEITLRFSKWGIHGMDGFFYSCIDTLNPRRCSMLRLRLKRTALTEN
jgi:hypothetical protein